MSTGLETLKLGSAKEILVGLVGTFRSLLGILLVSCLKMYAETLTCFDPDFKTSLTRPALTSFALPAIPLRFKFTSSLFRFNASDNFSVINLSYEPLSNKARHCTSLFCKSLTETLAVRRTVV